MIAAEELRVEFPGETGPTTVLDDINFFAPSRVLGIIGPNGSGKSTLLRTIAGIIRPSAGRIIISDVPLDREGRRGRAYVPQLAADGLWLDLTVRESLVLSTSRGRILWAGHRDWAYCQTEIPWLPPLIEDRLDQRVRHLSGGEKQVLLLVCALANAGLSIETGCLLADEFTSALDPHYAAQARAALRDALNSLPPKVIFVFVTHSFAELSDFASHVLALESGRVAWCCPIEQVDIHKFHTLYEPIQEPASSSWAKGL